MLFLSTYFNEINIELNSEFSSSWTNFHDCFTRKVKFINYNTKLLKFPFRNKKNLPLTMSISEKPFNAVLSARVCGLCNVFWTTLEDYWNLNFVWLGLCWGHECRQLLQMSFPEFNLILGIAPLIRSKCLKQSNLYNDLKFNIRSSNLLCWRVTQQKRPLITVTCSTALISPELI